MHSTFLACRPGVLPGVGGAPPTQRSRGKRSPIGKQTALCGSTSNYREARAATEAPPHSPGSGAARWRAGVGASRAGAGQSGRVTACLTYSGRRPQRSGPCSQWEGEGGGPPGEKGEQAAGGWGGRRRRASNPVSSSSPTAPIAGPSSLDRGRSSIGQAVQVCESSLHGAALRHPARARPTATMPKRKVSGDRGLHTPPPLPRPAAELRKAQAWRVHGGAWPGSHPGTCDRRAGAPWPREPWFAAFCGTKIRVGDSNAAAGSP